MAHWNAYGYFLFALIELFCYLLRFRSYEAKCVQLGWFRRGRPLCTQILPGQGRPPSTILGTRKLETLGYLMVKTALLSPSVHRSPLNFANTQRTSVSFLHPLIFPDSTNSFYARGPRKLWQKLPYRGFLPITPSIIY